MAIGSRTRWQVMGFCIILMGKCSMMGNGNRIISMAEGCCMGGGATGISMKGSSGLERWKGLGR